MWTQLKRPHAQDTVRGHVISSETEEMKVKHFPLTSPPFSSAQCSCCSRLPWALPPGASHATSHLLPTSTRDLCIPWCLHEVTTLLCSALWPLLALCGQNIDTYCLIDVLGLDPWKPCLKSSPESNLLKACSKVPVCAVGQVWPTLCNPMDCSLPGSSVHGNFQARILEWVAISSSRGSSQPQKRGP